MKQKIQSIVVMTSDYPAPKHNSFVFVQQLIHAMIEQKGVKITIVAPQSILHVISFKKKLLPWYSKGYTDSGIEYSIYRPYTILYGKKNPIKVVKCTLNWINRKIIESILNRIEYNIIYSHFWTNLRFVYKYAIKNKTPLYVACGESYNPREELNINMSEAEIDKMKAIVKGVICVSSEKMQECLNTGLASNCKIDVFPNCVDTQLFKFTNVESLKFKLGIVKEDFVISFVGGFIPRKGPDRIAEAVTLLNDPHIKVMFIGKQFSGHPHEFDCPGIIYKGTLDHDSLPQYLNCSDVFVLPTQNEGCCNAIVEALAIGLPVISSNGKFNDDILDDKNSIRINPNDIEAIALAIKTLKDNKDLRESMSKYSLSRHEEYSINSRARKILRFIEGTING